jgi:hypothetical protein
MTIGGFQTPALHGSYEQCPPTASALQLKIGTSARPPGSSEIKLHRFIVWAKLHLQRIVDVPPHLDRLKLWLLTAKHSLSG